MCKEEDLDKTETRCQIIKYVDIPTIHGRKDMTSKNKMNEIKAMQNQLNEDFCKHFILNTFHCLPLNDIIHGIYGICSPGVIHFSANGIANVILC